MNRSTTAKLNEILMQADDSEKLESYLDAYAPLTGVSLKSCLDAWMKEHHLSASEIVQKSGIERSYCYHILDGTKMHPSRDKILRLCIACEMDDVHVRKTLEAAGEAALYAKKRRDAVIAWGIHQHLSVIEINNLLDDFEMEPLA